MRCIRCPQNIETDAPANVVICGSCAEHKRMCGNCDNYAKCRAASEYKRGCSLCENYGKCLPAFGKYIDKPPLVTPRIAIEYMNRNLLSILRLQYKTADKELKTVLLDILTSMTGYSRRTAFRKMAMRYS